MKENSCGVENCAHILRKLVTLFEGRKRTKKE